jgi:hypothetical protein
MTSLFASKKMNYVTQSGQPDLQSDLLTVAGQRWILTTLSPPKPVGPERAHHMTRLGAKN